MKKRILPLLLAIAMVLSMLPMSAMAAELGSAEGAVASVTNGGSVAYYADLGEALAAVESNGTVTVLEDTVSLTPAASSDIRIYQKTNVTVDLNNAEVTVTPAVSSSGSLYAFIVYNSTVTVKNGTVRANAASGNASNPVAVFYNYTKADTAPKASLTLENLTVTAKNTPAVVNYSGDVVVDGTTINHEVETGPNYAAIGNYNYSDQPAVCEVKNGSSISHNGNASAIEASYASTGKVNITVKDSTLETTAGKDSYGILQMAEGAIDLTNTTITGAEAAVAMTKGSLTLKGDQNELTAKNASSSNIEYKPSADGGIYPQGSAIYVEPNGNVKNVTIEGGTITSAGNADAVWAPAKSAGSETGRTDLNVEVSGGTFSTPVDSDWVTAEAVLVEDGTYTYGDVDDLLEQAESGSVYAPDKVDDLTDPEDATLTFADGGKELEYTAEYTDGEYATYVGAYITLPAAAEVFETLPEDVSFSKWDKGNAGAAYLVEGDATITAQWKDNSTTTPGDGDDTTGENPGKTGFTDVPSTSPYAEAIAWGVEKGIIAGVTDTTFAPSRAVTRKEYITLLWRAEGRPEPETTENPFTDVKESAYYYKAVLWGVENKIVSGKTATTFAPNDTCTRAQAATFLWRYEGKPDTFGTDSFSDVPEGTYYTSAIAWGVANNIIYGKSNVSFAPNDTCTRAQSVTFLYRALAE